MSLPVRRRWDGVLQTTKQCHYSGRRLMHRREYHHIEERKPRCQVISTQIRPFPVRPSVDDSFCKAFGTTAILHASEPQITLAVIKGAKAEKARKQTNVNDKSKLKLKLIRSSDTKVDTNLPQTPSALLELEEAVYHARDLTLKYYDAVKAEDSVVWLTYDEVKGVSAGSMTKWLHPRVRNHNKGRVGLMRRHGVIANVTAYAERSDIRKRLTQWDEDANERLAPLFKKMVLARAKVARLGGFKNYLDLKSQFKMMDGKAAMAFVEEVRKALAPHIESYMEELLGMKMTDMDPSFSMAGLRHDIWKGRYSLQDFQDYDASRRLHWGEVNYYSQKQTEKDLWDGKLEKIHEYFPLDSTVRGLLDLFGHVFGLRFSEVLDQQQYDTIISAYLSSGQCSAPLIDREKLPVLRVQDTSRSAKGGAYLGVLVLDLIERPGKAHNPSCGWFADFPKNDQKNGEENLNKVPGYSISAGYSKTNSKLPTTLSHGELGSLAHELGHAIHNFVRGSNSDIPWDAIEIPSILCEHWTGDPRILQNLSSHYTYLNPAYLKAWRGENPDKDRPPIKAPLDTFDAVAFRRHPRNQIADYQRGLWMSKFDLMVHSYSEKDLEKADLAKDCQDILREWTGVFSAGDSKHKNNSYLNWTALETYQTSYYCYLLSGVYSIDIFEKYFAKDPMNRKQGIRFRRVFLEHSDVFSSIKTRDFYKSDPIRRLRLFLDLWARGRSENTMDALEKFMGRKLSNKAFIKSLNAPAKKQKSFWTRLKVKMGFGW